MKANDMLLARMKFHNTLVCCGLDPDMRKLPRQILSKVCSEEEKVSIFLRGVVDATAEYVCAYKVQKAFFDMFEGGHNLLREMIGYIHDHHHGIPVIIDCKIGDIGNTMSAYIENLFGRLNADGVVVNPYMGDDVLAPLMEYPDKAVVVLVKTSNPNGSVVQDVVLNNGQPLWRHILDLVINRWNRSENMIPVLSSTAGLNMKSLRSIIPNAMPILLAGVGAQGGNFADVRHLLNAEGVGPFINSSRGILYPDYDGEWSSRISCVALELRDLINKERRLI